jgi:hypothetical protein
MGQITRVSKTLDFKTLLLLSFSPGTLSAYRHSYSIQDSGPCRIQATKKGATEFTGQFCWAGEFHSHLSFAVTLVDVFDIFTGNRQPFSLPMPSLPVEVIDIITICHHTVTKLADFVTVGIHAFVTIYKGGKRGRCLKALSKPQIL